MAKGWVLLSVLGFAAAFAGTTVYRWVDASGVVHYSDRPHPGAEALNFAALPAMAARAPVTASPAATQTRGEPVPAQYTVRILAPGGGTTLRPVNHEVRVQVRIEPPLTGGARLQYELDGKPAGEPTVATTQVLREVYRGEHRLVVTVLGSDNRTAGRASATFYLYQHSLLFNRKPGPGG